ncbi:MAG: phosphotransferase [Acetobacteraceae bacterium]|nr:phosphotransferase [Acetobacteraceae bacterium]
MRSLPGGSNADVALIEREGRLFVRKRARGADASKLAEQYAWLQRWRRLPIVPAPLHGAWSGAWFTLDLTYCRGFRRLDEVLAEVNAVTGAALLDTLLSSLQQQLYTAPVTVYDETRAVAYIRAKLLGKAELAARACGAVRHLAVQDTVAVNGIVVPGLQRSATRLLTSPAILSELGRFERTAVHGDLTLQNVLFREGRFVVIDPNGENFIDDPVVDFAKLYQSLHSGYESLCRIAKPVLQQNSIRFSPDTPAVFATLHSRLETRLRQTLPAHRFRSLLFHEAVHLMRLLPYRIERQPVAAPVLFALALQRLAEFLGQYEAHCV